MRLFGKYAFILIRIMYTKAMKKRKTLRVITYMLLTVLLLAAAGCGKQDSLGSGTYFHYSIADQVPVDTQATETESVRVEDQDLYLVVGVDQMEETFRLFRYANGMEYRYYYGTGTRFLDEYGSRTTIASFTPGTLISIGSVNAEGILCDAQISAQAWVYDDVRRFAITPQQNMLQIGDSKYRYDENTYVFSGDERVTMEDIAQGDTLSVVGLDKKILSVRITTAQGTLALTNTDLFEGSFLQLGRKIFTEVTKDLTMQVAEGTYKLTVANNGWGGSTKVTIKRGQTTTVDLDKIKGKGPKSGKVRFLIDVSGAILLIDDREVDYSSALKLTYGQHSVAVYADGYDVWRRNLYVNSKNSTIIINLKDEQDATEADSAGNVSNSSNTANNTSDASGSSGATGSSQQNETSSQSTQSDTSSGQTSEGTKRQEELDLIRDLLSSMTKSNSIVSN